MKTTNYYLIMLFSIALLCSCEKEEEEFEPIQSNNPKDFVIEQKSGDPYKAITQSGAYIKYLSDPGQESNGFVVFEIGDFRYDFLYEVAPANIRKMDLFIDHDSTTEEYSKTITDISYERNRIRVAAHDIARAIRNNKGKGIPMQLTIEVAEGTYLVGTRRLLTRWDNFVTKQLKIQ